MNTDVLQMVEAEDHRGRLVYALLQNADDAMSVGTGSACIRFELTDTDLWVANSGREADIRGLCGISASKKSVHQGQKRRASIGHKGIERGDRRLREKTIQPMRNAFEVNGIQFITNGVIAHTANNTNDVPPSLDRGSTF